MRSGCCSTTLHCLIILNKKKKWRAFGFRRWSLTSQHKSTLQYPNATTATAFEQCDTSATPHLFSTSHLSNFAHFPRTVHAFVGYYFELSSVLFTIRLNYFYWTAARRTLFTGPHSRQPTVHEIARRKRSHLALQTPPYQTFVTRINNTATQKKKQSNASQLHPGDRKLFLFLFFVCRRSFDTVPFREQYCPRAPRGNLWSIVMCHQ